MQTISVNTSKKEVLAKQYKNIVKKEFEKSKKITKKVDTVNMIEEIEGLTKMTQSTLEQVQFVDNNFCAKVKTKYSKTFIAMLPKDTKIKSEGKESGIVHYCYKKI